MSKSLKEPLIKSEAPAAQGRVAIFNCCKRLKMKETENHTFLFPCSDNARDGINQSFLKKWLAIFIGLGKMVGSNMAGEFPVMAIAVTLHLLSVVVWVGGMFFAHMVLRGVLNQMLEPQARLPVLLKVFDGFFPWVWLSVILILASGYWMLFAVYDTETTLWLDFMTVVGTLMAAIFVFIYAIPYQHLSGALEAQEMPRAVAAVTLIRRLILTNLGLGLLIIVISLFGKYGLF